MSKTYKKQFLKEKEKFKTPYKRDVNKKYNLYNVEDNV